MEGRKEDKIALSLCAHPDDAEFLCAGTLALLREKGWRIHIASMTPGDCGSAQRSREEISAVRRAEAVRSAAILEGQYHCLECDDVFIMYDRVTLLKVIELIRSVKPSIVFTHCPEDYMVDHTTTGKLALTGCFACGMPNIEIGEAGCFESVPHLYYLDPIEGKDNFGNEVRPTMIVDVGSVFAIKEDMLACHASQREWLMQHHGMDEYMRAVKSFSSQRGEQAGAEYGEGLRQHLGHAFPQENIIKKELANVIDTL